MSKQQSKQVFNSGNTTLSQTRDQGKANQDQLEGALSGYQANAGSLFPGVSGGYSDIASSGGYDSNVLAALNTGYGDMALTGGFSPEQVSSMQNKAGRVAESSYRTGKDELQRNIAATGGYGFGDAAINKLARQGSEAASRSSNDVTAQIAGLQSQNKLAGLGGLGATQQGMVNNKLSALGGNSQLYNTNVAAAQNTLSDIIKNFQVTGQISVEDLKVLEAIGAQAGAGMNTLNTVTSLAGSAAGIMGALPGGKS